MSEACYPPNVVQGLQEGGEGRGRGDPLRKPQHGEEKRARNDALPLTRPPTSFSTETTWFTAMVCPTLCDMVQCEMNEIPDIPSSFFKLLCKTEDDSAILIVLSAFKKAE